MEVPAGLRWDDGFNYLYKPGQTVPFVKELVQPFQIGANQRRALALVLTNNTAKPLYFYANFHIYSPGEDSYGVKIVCLCNHHLYAVPPGATWSRIVSTRTTYAFRGREIKIKHDILGMTEKEFNDRGMLPYVDDSNEKD
jgi:hypothetical protein